MNIAFHWRIGLLAVLCVMALPIAACDSEDDEEEDELAAAGLAVFPEIMISGGYVYLQGEDVGGMNFDDWEIEARTDDGDVIELPQVNWIDGVIACKVPADAHTRIPTDTGATLAVTTPDGDKLTASRRVFAIEDSRFGGRTNQAGWGVLGNVYALEEGTGALPTAEDPCEDPSVLNDGDMLCPYTTLLVPNFSVPPTDFSSGFPGLGTNLLEWFAILFDGYLIVDTPGDYIWETCSDDGTLFRLPDEQDEPVVSNDGIHAPGCVQAAVMTMEAGRHPFTLHYFQGPATEISLELYWTKPDGTREIVPAENLRMFAEDF